MNHVLFPRKYNFSTIKNLDFHVIWFLKNHVEKNWVDVMLYHMVDSKKKSTTLPYGELIIKILVCINFDFEEEELESVHSKIQKCILRNMGYTIQ